MLRDRLVPVILLFVLPFCLVAALPRSARALGALLVYDSEQHFVGQFDPPSGVVRKLDGVFYALPLKRNGFSSTGFTVLYTTNDCSGTAYIAAHSGLLVVPIDFATAPVQVAGIFDNKVYTGQGTPVTLTILSFAGADDPTVSPKYCDNTGNGPAGAISVQPIVQVFDLTTLNLVPPFHVSR